MEPLHLYTRSGDDGYTNLLGKERVAKYAPQPEAYGTVDEANAAIGVARASAHGSHTQELLLIAQRDLYKLMTELAATIETAERFRSIGEERVRWLEEQTDELMSAVQYPREFIVPGDTLSGAYLDLARTFVRRAERLVVHLLHDGLIDNPHLVRYLNRLSSLLFALELYENSVMGSGKVTLAKE